MEVKTKQNKTVLLNLWLQYFKINQTQTIHLKQQTKINLKHMI